MNHPSLRDQDRHSRSLLITPILTALVVVVIFIGMLFTIWLTQTTTGTGIASMFQSLFAMKSVQAWWYVTRASGLTAYLLLWLSMAWGLAIPSKIFNPVLEGIFSYDFHEYLSLLGLGFAALHVVVLLLDRYLPFTVAQILIPFTDTYRPLWIGIGIIGLYIYLLVTVTFYLRKQIGTAAFRAIHVFSLLGYVFSTLHGLFSGTDSAFPIAKVLYALTFLIILFLTVYWLVMNGLNKREQVQIEATRNDRFSLSATSPKSIGYGRGNPPKGRRD